MAKIKLTISGDRRIGKTTLALLIYNYLKSRGAQVSTQNGHFKNVKAPSEMQIDWGKFDVTINEDEDN
ncbi:MULTISPECIES: hypothetical protein [unclassified Bradyrhizobium]|uniref:hypothetical protein n=1 Tax=unclassified Bradyrhizobium TaxID=2631580 RepID=UPI00339986DD